MNSYSPPMTQHTAKAILAVSLLALIFALLWPWVATYLPELSVSGHSHIYAHGHPFADARSFFGIPNAMDVLSNLPFAVVGIYGLWRFNSMKLEPAIKCSAKVFFIGFILTWMGSSIYHCNPSSLGLMLDRIGMAFAFAGVIALAADSRSQGANDIASLRALQVFLPIALLAAVCGHIFQNIWPWLVIQFGGMALVIGLAFAPAQKKLALNLFALIAWYILAKVCEHQDAAIYALTQNFVSGHSLKHLAACLAAWPILKALTHNQV